MTEKLMLPMAENAGRDYAVTLLEQQDLARRYELSLIAVKASLADLASRMLNGEVVPQKSATKTKRVIATHFESSNAIKRQGALANGPQWGCTRIPLDRKPRKGTE